MKKFFKVVIPILLVLAIIACIGWYLFIYDRDFTRDMLLNGARYFDEQGNHSVSTWLYDQAYIQADHNDVVAIELADLHKADGNYTKAEYTLTRAISDGGSAELYLALCKTYMEQDKLFSSEQTETWYCLNCGFIMEGTQAPKVCPVCSVEQGYFIRLNMTPWTCRNQ